ncbi:MAG: CAP domain-containing protein [Pleurocapsa sp. MO_226.B13]|nr:CAP domain-containing protein [Pleurocapsa sp. MO_226.B13]
MAKLTNQVRAKYRLRPLRSNCRLYKAAQNHTVNMVKMRRISHTGSDGSSVGVRVKRVGYQYSAVAENVAKGQKTPSQVVQSWMNSPGHRKNILNPKYTEIGIGYSNNYWTQVFGRSR